MKRQDREHLIIGLVILFSVVTVAHNNKMSAGNPHNQEKFIGRMSTLMLTYILCMVACVIIGVYLRQTFKDSVIRST